MPTPAPIIVRRLGLIDYQQAWDLQRVTHARVADGATMELLLCSHPPVYTLGRQTRDAHLPMERARLEALGAQVVDIDRGGSVTFHGPGQIIGYPIFDLARLRCGQDLHLFLRGLEESLIRALASVGILCFRVPGKTGVWTNSCVRVSEAPEGRGSSPAKIAAIGLKCSRWVTMHGFALNVTQDLVWFNHVVPCGLTEPVTSMADVLPDETSLTVAAVETALIRELCQEFNVAIASP